jgi:hypothetical protein
MICCENSRGDPLTRLFATAGSPRLDLAQRPPFNFAPFDLHSASLSPVEGRDAEQSRGIRDGEQYRTMSLSKGPLPGRPERGLWSGCLHARQWTRFILKTVR